ncbi:PIN domain-containing protein [Scytonema sp. NUACC21]
MDANSRLAPTHSGTVIELLSPIDAIASTQLPSDFHLYPVDRIIIAIARRYGISLVTCNTKIIDYPHVQTISTWKLKMAKFGLNGMVQKLEWLMN